MIHLVLCGGSGTRLWPISTSAMPKQFIKFGGAKSLLQQTILRAPEAKEVWLVLAKQHYHIARKQLAELKCQIPVKYFIEEQPHGTLAAVMAPLYYLKDDMSVLVSSADHWIQGEAFSHNLQEAISLAKNCDVVCFGIPPTSAHTGYGYIEHQETKIMAFHEKPDLTSARAYIEKGYLWNAGIFVFQSRRLLKLFENLYSQIDLNFSKTEEDVIHLRSEDYSNFPRTSFDYGILEKAQDLGIVKAQFQWSDLGSIESLEKYHNTPAKIAIDANRNYISSQKDVYLNGVSDLAIIEDAQRIVVSKKDGLKDLYEAAKSELPINKKIYRPWGSYASLQNSLQIQVKKVCIDPNEAISLQSHEYREEHWFVVRGEATVQIGEKTITCYAGDYFFVEKQKKHRISNSGQEELELIEVQRGTKLDENDIQRFEDMYQR